MGYRLFRVLTLFCLACCFFLIASASESSHPLARYATNLVVLKGDKLVPFKTTRFLKAPFTVLYFSAGWCPDCRKFSPALVEAYDHQPKKAQRFEVVLLSRDKTEAAMIKYMATDKMRWPALAFGKLETAEDLNSFYSGHGIPCLSVLDARGNLVLQSKSDQDAREILAELQRLVQ